MRHETPTEEIRKLAALYSLGALTQHEVNSFETHMREGCPVCNAEYHRFKHIAAEIGLGVNEAKAPEYIREMVLKRIESRKPEQPAGKEAEPAEEKEEAAQKEPEPVVQTPTAPAPKPILTQSAGDRSKVFPWILVVIFAAVAGFTIYLYYNQQSAYNILKEEKASLQTDLEKTQDLNDSLESRREEREQIIDTVSKPETRIFHLAGLAPTPESSGAILWDVVPGRCLIFGFMPPAPEGKTYQFWFITPSETIPSGTIKPNPSGRIYEWFPVPPDISNPTMVITLEPENGSQVPTLPYYAVGRND